MREMFLFHFFKLLSKVLRYDLYYSLKISVRTGQSKQINVQGYIMFFFKKYIFMYTLYICDLEISDLAREDQECLAIHMVVYIIRYYA